MASPITCIYINYLAGGSLFKKELRMKAVFKDKWTEKHAFVLHSKFKTDVSCGQSS